MATEAKNHTDCKLRSELETILREEIARTGPISFASFMQRALYEPGVGYYQQPSRVIGRGGDFFTSVSVGSVFGEMLACQICAWLAEGPDTKPVHILEAGAHDGRLATDILCFLSAHCAEFADRIEYWILEPSSTRRAVQEEALVPFASRVRWASDWHGLPEEGIRGVIFANELLDAMPVHRFGWDAGCKSWFEWGVDAGAQGFAWTRLPQRAGVGGDPARALLPELPDALLGVLPDGFVIEVSPDAADWWGRAAKSLRRGKIATFDYGFTLEQSLQPRRAGGSLRAYYRHQITSDLLAHPGEMDLTAHVNFTVLQTAGEAAGLRTDGLLTQAAFFTRITELIERGAVRFPPWTPARLRQFHTLTHPGQMGEVFRVLVQGR